MTKIKCLILITLSLCLSASLQAEIIFQDDWESGCWNAYDDKLASGGSCEEGEQWFISQMQTNIAGAVVDKLEGDKAPTKGNYSMQFTWFQNSFNLTSANSRSKAHLWTDWEYLRHTDRWYGFRTFMPSGPGGMSPDSEWEVLVQWHGRPNTGAGEPHRIPAAAISHKDDRLVFNYFYDENWITKDGSIKRGGRLNLGKADLDVWIDWLIRIKWDWNGKGILEINRKNAGGSWVRIAKLYDVSIGYNDVSDPQVGIGIYKHDATKRYNEGEPLSDHYRRRIYFDDFTIATTKNEAKP